MATPRQILESMGMDTRDMKFEQREYTFKHTKIWDMSESVGDFTLWRNSGENSIYQDGEFPNTSQGVVFTHLAVEANIAFTTADPKLNGSYLQHFQNQSAIEFSIENKVVLKSWLRYLSQTKFYSNGATTAVPYNSTIYKFNNDEKLQLPLVIGAGRDFRAEFKAAPSLTTAAKSAGSTDEAYTPGSDAASLTTANISWAMWVWAKGFKYYQTKAM